ncbi:competence protein ComER [Actinacidiphila rubida]|uniref:Competence protein ComER n=1 Tax=Actinacidiphila rubida TaxID=310780 RepID=A0A1H8S105_9ACTN|nr:pyrroline-5-carboxylate reductase dimerization domain-containing protein [Actinacidiphila rubida]SEO72217.1 competence protein ComER [Actinacidiphila rubida]
MSEFRSAGVVGLGRMGLALATGFGQALPPGRVVGAGRSADSVARFREAVPGAAVAPLAELPGRTNLIVLCTRNVDLPGVLGELGPGLTDRHVVVTIDNGLLLRALAEAVPGPVAKLIPSAGNQVGAGATLLVPGPRLTAGATADLLDLLRSFSNPFVIDEEQGRAATDLASCGPALLAGAARAMLDAQQERAAPLARALAEQLVAQSLHAVSRLMGDGADLDEIVRRVAVPGGNTAAGLQAAQGDLVAAWRAAFAATAENERSRPVPRLAARGE